MHYVECWVTKVCRLPLAWVEYAYNGGQNLEYDFETYFINIDSIR